MSWKKPKKINNSKHCFYHTYINSIYSSWYFCEGSIKPTACLFSPKTIIVSEQKAYSVSGGSLTVGNAVVVGDSIGKVGASV
jgi:hypothetical protein